MEEIWKPLKLNPDCYEVSNYGRVRSIAFFNQWGYFKRKEPLILKTHKNKGGYVLVSLVVDGKHCSKSIHRLVFVNFVGEINDGLEINHKDGNKANNMLDNLEICNHSYNMAHAYNSLKRTHGRIGKCGNLSPVSKAIKCIDDNGNTVHTFESARLAAKFFNKSHGYISIAARTGRKSCGYHWIYIN